MNRTNVAYFVALFIPLAATLYNCVPGGSCEGLEPIPLVSGTYTSESWSSGQDLPPQATGGSKTLMLDVEANRVELSYSDAEGRKIVEHYTIVATAVR